MQGYRGPVKKTYQVKVFTRTDDTKENVISGSIKDIKAMDKHVLVEQYSQGEATYADSDGCDVEYGEYSLEDYVKKPKQ